MAVELAQRLCDAMNSHDVERLKVAYCDDVENSDPTQVLNGIDAVLAYWQGLWTAFKDLSFVVGPGCVGDEKARANEWIARGTHTGPLTMPDGSAIPGSGRVIELKGMSYFELRDGKVHRQRDYFDVASQMTQLGLVG
ncbi:MAG: ester cyclase [Acidimicrobiia bacterium]|nr:ester cyclase [Acidimicrobiia bacterium]